VNICIDTSHIAGRIRRVDSGILGIRHWGVEDWSLDANGQPAMWHAQKGDVLRCATYIEFAASAPSEIVWTPQTHAQQVSVIQRLQSIEGLAWNLATANCEQVVRWAVEGKAHSDQLVNGTTIAVCIGVAVYFASRP
jgi:hypothetical protein